MKIKCPDCSFVAEHPTDYAKALLGRHRAKMHGYVSPSAKYRQPRKPEVQPEGEPPAKPKKFKQLTPVNFCPGCGCNLRAVAVAMNLGGKL